ncbi:hypothetical protein EDD85DRAFT_797153 [Armillaria nabsnona]|nr:hypothetical protein EDD85DRAFT_797153 [Armillaria nabsnona]
MPAPQKFDTPPSLTWSPSLYDDDLLYDVELELKVVSVCPKAKELGTNVASSSRDSVMGRAWTSGWEVLLLDQRREGVVKCREWMMSRDHRKWIRMSDEGWLVVEDGDFGGVSKGR